MARIGRGIRLGGRQARTHAVIMAVVGWACVAAFVGLGPGNRSRFGPLKWSDFVHFYTLGDVARHHDAALLYDAEGLHARQAALVPESAGDVFIPVYGPQTALLFAPLSVLPYFTAGLLWALITMAVYAWAVWLAWRPARGVLTDRTFVIAAALAFPPVWQLPPHGQTTAVLLFAFAAGWRALEADRRILAGLVLSLVAVKPQFGLVLGPVAIMAGEWRLVAGGALGIGVQALAALAVFDTSVFGAYAEAVRQIPAMSALLEPRAFQMHSLRALTQLLPGRADSIAWSLASVVLIATTLRVWRQAPSWRLRMGVLVMASALVNPHLTIYDVTVMALPIVWIGGWLIEEKADTTWYWQHVYWIAVALFLPTAAFAGIQVSPILMSALFLRVVRVACRAPNAIPASAISLSAPHGPAVAGMPRP